MCRFLVDNHWFKQAKKYLAWEGSLADSGGTVGDESANPGPIDNKPLWKEDGSDIREHMIDEMDYVLVPEEAWDMLVAEFGLQDNVEGTSSAVKRKVVEHGMFVKQFKVRIFIEPFWSSIFCSRSKCTTLSSNWRKIPTLRSRKRKSSASLTHWRRFRL